MQATIGPAHSPLHRLQRRLGHSLASVEERGIRIAPILIIHGLMITVDRGFSEADGTELP